MDKAIPQLYRRIEKKFHIRIKIYIMKEFSKNFYLVLPEQIQSISRIIIKDDMYG